MGAATRNPIGIKLRLFAFVFAPEGHRNVATGETRGMNREYPLAPVGATETVAPTGARNTWSHVSHGFHPWLHSGTPTGVKRNRKHLNLMPMGWSNAEPTRSFRNKIQPSNASGGFRRLHPIGIKLRKIKAMQKAKPRMQNAKLKGHNAPVFPILNFAFSLLHFALPSISTSLLT